MATNHKKYPPIKTFNIKGKRLYEINQDYHKNHPNKLSDNITHKIVKYREKNHSSPLTILKEHNINKYNMIANIPPIFVDNYVKDSILIKKGEYLK
ncbi:MAG: hypothetical protein M0Q94_08250 [Candidatus Cloacimonetes bacterium]|nr:hypothetical protein [Candidatus Cloacimonadota bacterium]